MQLEQGDVVVKGLAVVVVVDVYIVQICLYGAHDGSHIGLARDLPGRTWKHRAARLDFSMSRSFV